MFSKNAFIAFSRFGFGPRPPDIRHFRQNPANWLRSQMKPLPANTLFSGLGSTKTRMIEYIGLKNAPADQKKEFNQKSKEHYLKEMQARFAVGLNSEFPFYERLVQFWSNHFTVSVRGKPFIAGIAGAYEREAIRPHIFGNFSDMLLAVTRHPAMLMYLDNAQSIGPNSRLGKNRSRGLNENLAREILELHTLGVSGGYTQKDVIALAKIITGWTIGRREKQPFIFRKIMHEPGNKILLGKTYGEGEDAGIQALTDLARHPSTARFLATKLARHFIADEPAESDIRALESSYMRSGGNLKAVYETLIGLSSVWRAPLPKVKTPYEMILSTLRLMNVKSMDAGQFEKVISSLALMNQMPFQALSPAGWADTGEAWMSPDALMNRIEWCHAVCMKLPLTREAVDLGLQYISPVTDAGSIKWIERAPGVEDGMALILSSPAHQRR